MNNFANDYSVAIVTGSNNISSDGSTAGAGTLMNRTATDNPAPGAGDWVMFQSLVGGSEDLHLRNHVENDAIDNGVSLATSFTGDIDGGLRTTPWDVGADDVLATTAVDLVRFEALGHDGAIELVWETASEIDNLGFHLFRSSSAGGPFERVTSRVIPGLGSSPVGAHYAYRDEGLVNGKVYFYKLQDIETTGKETLHGPVSAMPNPESDSEEKEETARIRYGDPEASGVAIVEQTPLGVVIELETRGFYALPLEDGAVRIEVPGFEEGEQGLAFERVSVPAIAGRHVDVVSVQGFDVSTFGHLTPAGERLEPEASSRGTVQLRRKRRARTRSSSELANLASVAFQGVDKKALLELYPIRWDGTRLVVVRRIRVRLSFQRLDRSESPTGRRVRHLDRKTRSPIARFATCQAGLHVVRFEEILRQKRAIAASRLTLARQGRPVAFHIEPHSDSFSPGSQLYFVSGSPNENPYGKELVFELSWGRGETMEIESGAPLGVELSHYWQEETREENRLYQAALLDAPDLWLWDLVMSRETKRFSFVTTELAPVARTPQLQVWLQGTSDFPVSPDHHLRLYVNGFFVAEASFDGKIGHRIEAELPFGILVEGENELEVENVGDTEAAYSMVMLDRFQVAYPRQTTAAHRELRGRWSDSGSVELALPGAYVLDVTNEPRWLSGTLATDSGVRFAVTEGREYWAIAAEAVHRPEVRFPRSRLRSRTERADYVAIGPRALLEAVEPLLARRREQGLTVRSVATEEIYESFGFGESSPRAIADFVSYAYHEWDRPSLRYVLLVGDANYDFKDYLGTGVPNDVPPLIVRTDYLWTASDPAYAAVNGDDDLPDIAIGRLPVSSVEQARSLADKIIAFEQSGEHFEGRSVVVSDNADRGGDFESNARELTEGLLRNHDPRSILLGELGREATRAEIAKSLNEGAATLSYIGHGAIHLWADENIFQREDVALLTPQPEQPLLLTMNCLNGYFHFPFFDSLAETLVEAEHRGAIAAISPSGLSLDVPAHRFHKLLLNEILHGGHERLGDAILAAQSDYVETGAYPELLRIYHLFGDPALRLR